MRPRLALLPLAALLLVAGCANSSNAAADYAKLSPWAIDANARAALTALTSVHIEGNVTQNGRAMEIDMSIGSNGTCAGRMSMGRAVAQIIASRPPHVYMKANLAFWQQYAGANPFVDAALADKWITGMPASATRDIAQCSISYFLKYMKATPIDQDYPILVGPTIFDGTPAVQISVENFDGSRGIMTVEAAAPHDVLKVSQAGSGQLTFSQFNVPVNATAPSGAVQLRMLFDRSA